MPHAAYKFLPQCCIQAPSVPRCERIWFFPTMTESVFLIWATSHYNTYFMLDWHLQMSAQNILLIGISLDMQLHHISLCIVEVRRLAGLASCVSFVIKSFAMQQSMRPAQWWNTFSQSIHWKEKWINGVRSISIGWFNVRWPRFGLTKETQK